MPYRPMLRGVKKEMGGPMGQVTAGNMRAASQVMPLRPMMKGREAANGPTAEPNVPRQHGEDELRTALLHEHLGDERRAPGEQHRHSADELRLVDLLPHLWIV